MNNEKSLVVAANRELSAQTSDPSVMRALTATIFKGFRDEKIVKQACLEAMMRGYSFQDIINKKIYAIPFGSGYSLVQSISDVRSIAMESGQVGKSAPEFEERDGKIFSCTITVKRKVADYIGDYTATVYFDEYNKGKDNWLNKPRTMIAKVAEMHALRMAFPEKLSQAYVEEEFENDERKIEAKVGAESESMKMGNFIKLSQPKNDEKNKEGKDSNEHAEGGAVAGTEPDN
jgi:hypothetical protein